VEFFPKKYESRMRNTSNFFSSTSRSSKKSNASSIFYQNASAKIKPHLCM